MSTIPFELTKIKNTKIAPKIKFLLQEVYPWIKKPKIRRTIAFTGFKKLAEEIFELDS